jgi:hypothetical protein
LALARRARSTDIDVSGPAGVAGVGGDSQGMHSPTVVLGASRLALGGIFLAFPVPSVRLLGVDSASAARLSWLARMAAARDLALGVGVLRAAVTQRGRVPALLGSALVDAADAVLIAVAARDARVDRVRGLAMAAGAAGAACAGIVAAADLLRRGRAAAPAGVAQEASRRSARRRAAVAASTPDGARPAR